MKKIIGSFFSAAMFVTASLQTHAQGTLYVSNFGQTSGGSAAIAKDSWIAEGFKTGTNASGYTLDYISLLINVATGTPSGFNISIYSENSANGDPGNTLGSLTGSLNPLIGGVYSYTNSELTLLPSMDYFVVVTAATPEAVGSYQWNYHLFDGRPIRGNDGWYLSIVHYNSSDGLTWSFSRDYVPQLAIYATPIPEPSAVALAFLGGSLAIFVCVRKKILKKLRQASLCLTAVMFIAASLQTHAQGFIYDQQSTNPPSTSGDYLDIQEDSPLLQSFIPSLSAIGFVQFELWDFSGTPNNGNNGATVYVKLWTGSPNPSFATLLGSTTPVYMPEAFGELTPGVTNFYFSTSILLTPGQTYYLQPVVLSGDDPWDIWSPGDTYPNGQLFEKGIALGLGTDLWFREGIVPEPTTLALIGLSGVLAYAFKRRSKLFMLLGAGLLFLGMAHAQVLSAQPASGDSVVQIVADEAGLQPATALPRAGTFWVMTAGPNGNLTALPYPGLTPSLAGLPIYSVTPNAFIVDASGSDALAVGNASRLAGTLAPPAMTASTLQAQADMMNNLIEQIEWDSIDPGGTNGGHIQFNYSPPVYTSGLWLEILTGDTNTIATNRLHGTVGGDHYQLLS